MGISFGFEKALFCFLVANVPVVDIEGEFAYVFYKFTFIVKRIRIAVKIISFCVPVIV